MSALSRLLVVPLLLAACHRGLDLPLAPGSASSGDLGSSCGNAGQACCLGNSCNSGGCCVENECVANGADCGEGLGTCAQSSCGGACGGLGQPCCAMQQTEGCSSTDRGCGGCTESGTNCSPEHELGGTCVSCGHEGEHCCDNAACVLGVYSICMGQASPATNRCTVTCGHPGEPCCDNDVAICRDDGCCMVTGSGGATCVAAPTCGCSAGQCTTCGLTNAACCAGQACELGQGECAPVSGGQQTCQMSPET